MPNDLSTARLHNLLINLYGCETGDAVYSRLQEKIHQFKQYYLYDDCLTGELTERDAILITYADQVTEAGKLPLQTLAEFCQNYLRGIIRGIHLLPFFPSFFIR